MDRMKYPRTPHLPWSVSRTNDDVCLETDIFIGKEVVMSEKLDGEATTIYSDGYCHARSTDSGKHASRSWLKQFAAQFAHDLPKGWRVSGENLFALHSILYTDLPSYFFVYAIFDQNNVCLSWDATEVWCELLGLKTVPVIYRGVWKEDIKKLWTGKGVFPTFESKKPVPESFPEDFTPCNAEGYVIRSGSAFGYGDFGRNVGKHVRESHVQTDSHWMEREPFPNLLS